MEERDENPWRFGASKLLVEKWKSRLFEERERDAIDGDLSRDQSFAAAAVDTSDGDRGAVLVCDGCVERRTELYDRSLDRARGGGLVQRTEEKAVVAGQRHRGGALLELEKRDEHRRKKTEQEWRSGACNGGCCLLQTEEERKMVVGGEVADGGEKGVRLEVAGRRLANSEEWSSCAEPHSSSLLGRKCPNHIARYVRGVLNQMELGIRRKNPEANSELQHRVLNQMLLAIRSPWLHFLLHSDALLAGSSRLCRHVSRKTL